MKTRATILFTLTIFGCTRDDGVDSQVNVSNVTVGLMRQRANGSWHIYSQGNTFPLRPNGTCVVAEKSQECMYYGFEFDYVAPTDKMVLACHATFNKPTDMVDADRIEANDTYGTTFAIPFERTTGHIAVPASVFRQPDDSPAPWTVEVSCTHREKELLRFKFTALHEA